MSSVSTITRPYLAELGNIDQTGEVLEVGALVVEFAQSIMLSVVALAQRSERVRIIGTAMHSAHHARDEAVDTPTLLHEWHKRRDPALIVGRVTEMREDKLLERVDLVLKTHEIRNGLIASTCMNDMTRIDTVYHAPFVRIVDALQSDVFLVLKQAIELWTKPVET